MNPLYLMQMLKGGNPKTFLMNMIYNQMGDQNPMISNLITMAKNGDKGGVEKFARNVCKEKGIDFDKEFNNFMNQVNSK